MAVSFCLLFVAILSAAAVADDDDWVNVSGRYLKFFKADTWENAAKTCTSQGALLVCVDHPAIHDYLANKGGLQWIGASDRAKEGSWTWTSGAPVGRSYFAPSEPNNCCGGQDCAVINWKKPGQMDDQKCTLKRPFFCQAHRVGFSYGLPGRAIKLHAEKKTWDEAVQICRSEGGELVKDNHPAVHAWLISQKGWLWIGATDEGDEGTFRWNNGKEVPGAYWLKGEPNNYRGNENCVVINFKKAGAWNDQTCQAKNAFACQATIGNCEE